MKRIRLTSENHTEVIIETTRILAAGGIIIYPTETCYGVGVDAANPAAVKKLLQYKDRPEGKAISIAVSDKAMAERYVVLNEAARNIYRTLLPGPITVISQTKDFRGVQGFSRVTVGIPAEDGSLGVRMPDYPFILELIKIFGKPITATSANMSGRKTPYTIEDILDNIPRKKKNLIDLIIDVGELPHNPPSTVVDTRLNDERVLREGSLSFKTQKAKLKSQNHNVKVKTFISRSEEETQTIGGELMKNLIPELQNNCIIFALQGELGAGKTQFAKGVARALGIKENVTSPTYTLIKEYEFSFANRKSQIVNRTLFHIDTWRIQEEKELIDLGFEKMIRQGNVVVIEWVEKISQLVNIIKSPIQIVNIVIEGENETREVKILS